MAKAVVFKPANQGKTDVYEKSVGTNYQRDQVTGEIFKTSGSNVKTIIPEMYKSAKKVYNGSAVRNNSRSMFYTVPTGKVFILAYAQCSCAWNNVAVPTDVLEYYVTDGALQVFFRICPAFQSAGQETETLNPTMMLVFNEGAVFEVNSPSVNVWITGRAVGYEVDKSEYLGVFN